MRSGAVRPPLALAVACLLALPGCQGRGSPGDEDHAGHVIPAHKPKDFPSAVARLRELDGQIASKFAEGKARSLVEDRTLPIALDIANWLPEIAADSDMPETPWDRVNASSSTLVESYQKLLAGATGGPTPLDASSIIKQAGSVISSLESALASADPAWFTPAKPGGQK